MRRTLLIPVMFFAACSEPPAAPSSDERQATGGIGYARTPALSRDGSMIAFSAGPDDQHTSQIWVRRADLSTPAIPLTSDESQNYDPEFSPDGSAIYFTSSRSPEGIYRVPVSGGPAELAISGGLSLKISPDGKRLLYANGRVFVRAIDGDDAMPLLPAIDTSWSPVWSPDGRRVLVTAKNNDQREPQWWIADMDGGEPHQGSILDSLHQQGFNAAYAHAWLPGDWLVFGGRQGETMTLWKIRMTPDGAAIGNAEHATTDLEGDSSASSAAGKVVFQRTQVDMNYWALPLDASGDRLAGPLEPLTDSTARKGEQSATAGKLLYSAEAGDRFALFLKDGAKQTRLRDAFFSVLAPDGSRYAYGDGTKDRVTVSMKSLTWWRFWSTELCRDCGMPRGFSADGTKLLLWSDSPPMHHIDVLDVRSRQVHRAVSSNEDLSGPQISPDGNWVSFVAKMAEHRWQTFAAPLHDDRPSASFEWMPVTDISDSFHFAFWSANGEIVYILTAHEGSGNLRWLEAQHVDPRSKHPIGTAVPVHEFADRMPPGMDPIWNRPAVVGNRIILELGRVSSNIWIKEAR